MAMSERLSPHQILLGIATASGLIIASCLSAVPSITCSAIASTYSDAIGAFGFLAIMALCYALLIQLNPVQDLNLSGKVTVAAVLYFVLFAVHESRNLSKSLHYCLVGSDSELSSRVHKEVKVVSPFDVLHWNQEIGE
jgi:hypothetical protein